MKIFFKRTVIRLRNLKYINRSIVFMADLAFSVLGTILSYVFIFTALGQWKISGSILTMIVASAIISTILFLSTKLYKTIIRHSSLKDLPKIFYILIAKEFFLAGMLLYLGVYSLKLALCCAVLDLLITSFLMIGTRSLIVNLYYSIVQLDAGIVKCSFMYGIDGKSPIVANLINNNISSPYRIEGFLSKDKAKKGIRIINRKVYYSGIPEEELLKLFKHKNIRYLIFSSSSDFGKERDGLVDFCMKNQISVMMAGEMQNIKNGKNAIKNIKPIQIEDLLERDEIMTDVQGMEDEYRGETILITGAAGSIGCEISRQIAAFDIKSLILFDNAETPLHNLQLEMTKAFPNKKIQFVLGDVRSKDKIKDVFNKYKPTAVFHAAAYKHVPMMEMNPCEAIFANVWGTINCAVSALNGNVKKFVMISTDKAVNPTSVMGASKRIAEMYVQHLSREKTKTQFVTTRFGNVLGSNGSVIPYFRSQIAEGGPVTVTHKDIVRYFMTIPEACRLVLQAAVMGKGGEIYVFDMGKQIKIADLARKMILLSGLVPEKDIEIKYTGLRPGEKLYEELICDMEKTLETKHKKIRVCMAVNVNKDEFEKKIKELIGVAKRSNIDQTIQYMKEIVPEFVSNNSEFEKYDNKNNNE